MTVAIITARGGSKRLPKKNIHIFDGKPMIAYPILAALKAGCFDRVMVSTDDEDIANIARQFGAEIPFMRSEVTSSDTATTDEVIDEVISMYAKEGVDVTRFVCIYPTAVFVTAERLKEAVALLDEHESVMSVASYPTPPQRAFVIGENGSLSRKYPEYALTRSQDLETLYHDCGMFYACRTEAFLREKTTDVEDLYPVILNEGEYRDIDTKDDLVMAERLWKLLKEKN